MEYNETWMLVADEAIERFLQADDRLEPPARGRDAGDGVNDAVVADPHKPAAPRCASTAAR